ncbi:unnamed protein product [Mesocestoides corti]|uniref:TPR_REGION domain-containing protein n=1 Tax=Mesocestoides corti TaxID=53468 RepID=A0A0R3UF94_MESCO|nr:unnamed protein product [Mesocestoides corti]
MLDHSPDLSDGFRGVIEKELRALTVGSTVEIEVENTCYDAVSTKSKISVHLDRLSVPQNFLPTPVADEEEKNQPKLHDNPQAGGHAEHTITTNNCAWRVLTSRLWLARAIALKARGTHLLTETHGSLEPFAPSRLEAAFRCYSRALQLVTLLSVVARLPANEEEEEEEEKSCEMFVGFEDGEYIDMDSCSPIDFDPLQDKFELDALAKLHFSLLSNMALCQLKAGSLGFAVKQCTTALDMAPDDDTLLAEEHVEHRISLKEVEKVLYRRALAYSMLDLLDEGIADTQRVLRLNPANQAACRLYADLKSRVSALNSKLAERLKKAF